ncbi:hypothetical protein FACS189415_7170 [Bacteroidia bacterium]|nr:hypothetical protein FACS189432_08320 [Bacteroidia bacterium]GHT86552.1 hypothetical protein FACS18947_6470 [Bacteroidia bacterium]GHU83872.1 hypothetical protein FACS189415_7170 [Bacteroidia bacterium]GHV70175.1 hypothetical protein FACS189420_0180 [Bacteroidia bacterium]
MDDNRMFQHLIEFVLVDFGSTDGLQDWVKNNFKADISTGYLKYYYTEELPFWHASIAKNTAHLLANHKIAVNLDCDNYTGYNGGKFVIQQFIKFGDNIVLHQLADKIDGSYGRISLTKDNFLKIGGYDEILEPMAYQDSDLLLRLSKSGIQYILNPDTRYNRAIYNPKEESICNSNSTLTWEEMHFKNINKSHRNVCSGKLIVNVDKKNWGIRADKYEY